MTCSNLTIHLHAKNRSKLFGSKKYALQELEAESTAFVVANHLNIDTKDYSIGYLNSWGFDKISDEQLENVIKNDKLSNNKIKGENE